MEKEFTGIVKYTSANAIISFEEQAQSWGQMSRHQENLEPLTHLSSDNKKYSISWELQTHWYLSPYPPQSQEVVGCFDQALLARGKAVMEEKQD